jgi:hypothetical protein
VAAGGTPLQENLKLNLILLNASINALHCKNNVIINLKINKNLYRNVSGPFISVNQ